MPAVPPGRAVTYCTRMVANSDARVNPVFARISRQGELECPARDQLVLVEQRAAGGIARFALPLEALKTAVAPGRAGIERQDGVAREHEAPAQRTDRRVGRGPVRRERAGRERLDLVAVVSHARR